MNNDVMLLGSSSTCLEGNDIHNNDSKEREWQSGPYRFPVENKDPFFNPKSP